MKNLTIIGGGPAALMLAAQLDTTKFNVTICEKKKKIRRKFLVAGEGGLNLTYNAPLEKFISYYTPSEFMAPYIREFTNQDLINWLNQLGIPTFIGSSNRVFPDLNIKPIKVLNTIEEHIVSKKINFLLETKWIGWNEQGHLRFENREDIESDIVVFALGGASWKVTGSDGKWSKYFEEHQVVVHPFRAANCAFGIDWNKDFITAHEGKPLKNIALKYKGRLSKGEVVISKFGMEGNAIYAISQKIQETLLTEDNAVILLDLKPTMTVDQIKTKFNSSKLTKVTDVLKKVLKIDSASIGLLKQYTDKETFLNSDLLSATIKSVPITIHAADALDKAISTLGGIALDEVDKDLQLKKIPNSYVIGEMLDWFAPTGGFLLQGSFSMGYALAKHLNELEHNNQSY